MAPRFSSSWSVVETPRSTELTPSLRRHQAKKRENTLNMKNIERLSLRHGSPALPKFACCGSYRWLTVQQCSSVCLPVDGALWSWWAACGPPHCSPAPSATGTPSNGENGEKHWFHTAVAHWSGGSITPSPLWSGINPGGELVKSNWPSSLLWSTPVLHRCTSLWLIHKQAETRSWLRPLKESNDDTHAD